MKSSTEPASCGCAPASPRVSASRGSHALAFWSDIDKPLLALALGVAAIALWLPHRLLASLLFTGQSLLGIAPWLAVSVLFAAYAKASGADTLVARAFTGSPARMVLLASLFGALSPFCSCGVVPVIAGLLGAGVPLAAVMAFWMSSPLMDPEMFALTAASLGVEFAVVKTLAAIGIGMFSGAVTHLLAGRGLLPGALRAAPSGCASNRSAALQPHWNVMRESARRNAFFAAAAANGWFLLRWMSIAFLLESLMVVYLPAEKVLALLGQNAAAIPLAVLVGIPSYLNGYAALPLVRGLIELGMDPAVALAFLVGGGVTSIPAATAVWALVRPRVFVLYVALACVGSIGVGYAYGALLALR